MLAVSSAVGPAIEAFGFQRVLFGSSPAAPLSGSSPASSAGDWYELARESFAELGVEQEIVNTPFETITTGAAFNTGECDLAAAGMTITEERAEVIEFSEGYFDANQAVVAKADANIADEAGLAGVPIAAQTGTTGLQYAEENLGDAEVITYEDLPLSLQALQNGEVEAVINDNGVLYDFAKENTDYAVGFDIQTGEQYGIAAKKGNTALIEKVDEVIGAAREDGTYDGIYEEWFGTAPAS